MVLREVSKIDVNYVKKLYKEAFPIRERMPFSRLIKLQKNNIIKMFAAYENGEPCALEIEKPDENKPMTVRRKEFYLRCGLRETGTEISLAGVPMEILIKGDSEFDKYEYIDIYRKQLGRQMTKLLLKIK